MNLLLLNGKRDTRTDYNSRYRGTYRAHPTHCDALPDDHEINRLFFWFLEEGGELGIVGNIAKALRFVELWNSRLNKKDQFEVVEATDGRAHPQSGGEFIGFDLSAGYNNSLLASGMRLPSSVSALGEPIRELLDLASQHFAPQLNGQGLFQTFEVACFCLRSMIALQDLSPNLFEGGDLRSFHPVGLYAVQSLIH